MRHHICIRLSITFLSKWHMGSGDGSLLSDRIIRRDSRNCPFIPGSTFKGVIRENCEKLSRSLNFKNTSNPHQRDLTIEDSFKPLKDLQSPVDGLFGNTYESGQLFFRDARLQTPLPYEAVKNQTRVHKHRLLGTSKENHLFSTEYAMSSTDVTSLILKTQIDGYHDRLYSISDAEPPYAYCLLIAAIMLTSRMGGDKSTGSGQMNISFDKILYNNQPLEKDDIFDYLDSELYELTMEEA
jgi:CRISPR/Cas system CSM-associated protein Csm3 (group 7 of RAMP superfamily)